jgi:hypothetical protein
LVFFYYYLFGQYSELLPLLEIYNIPIYIRRYTRAHVCVCNLNFAYIFFSFCLWFYIPRITIVTVYTVNYSTNSIIIIVSAIVQLQYKQIYCLYNCTILFLYIYIYNMMAFGTILVSRVHANRESQNNISQDFNVYNLTSEVS